MQYSTFITFFDIVDFSSSTYDFSLPGFPQINVFCVIFFLPILVFHNKKIYHPKEDNKDSSSILRLGHLTIAIARAITPSFSPIQHTLFACPSMHPSSLSLSLSPSLTCPPFYYLALTDSELGSTFTSAFSIVK